MNRPAPILTQLETSLSVAPEALAQRFGVGSKTIATDVAQINQALGAAGSIRLAQGRYRLLVVDVDAFREARDRMVNEHRSAAVFAGLVPQLIEASSTIDVQTVALRAATDEIYQNR